MEFLSEIKHQTNGKRMEKLQVCYITSSKSTFYCYSTLHNILLTLISVISCYEVS